MAHRPLETLSTFILLNCIVQGRQDAETFRYQEVLVGQDIALPCIVQGNSSLHIVMIEWSRSRREENTKLALYIPFRERLFSPNISLVVDNTTMSSYLQLHRVTKWDSDIYTCSLSTFPLGSVRREIELKVTDVATGTDKGHITESTESIRTTPLTNQHSTAVTQNTDAPTDTTAGPNTSQGFATAERNATSYTDNTQSRVTTATSPALSTSSDDQGTRTHFTAFSEQSPVSDASTSHRGPEFISTRGTGDDTLLRTRQPEAKPSTSREESWEKITDRPGNTHATTALTTGDRVSKRNEGLHPGGTLNYLSLALTIVLVLVFLAMATVLYRKWKWKVKQRMDLPPPFKPPPPPVKYNSAIYRQPSAQSFNSSPKRY